MYGIFIQKPVKGARDYFRVSWKTSCLYQVLNLASSAYRNCTVMNWIVSRWLQKG